MSVNKPDIAIAHSGVEALAAYLAAKLAPEGRKRQFEEQLEAFVLADALSATKLDTGAKFRELRHRNGFLGRDGGTLWSVIPELSDGRPDTANQAESNTENITLPLSVAHRLHELNRLQDAYDKTQDEKTSLQHLLFSDWTQYMQAQHTPQQGQPTADNIKSFINEKSIPRLEQKETELTAYSNQLGSAKTAIDQKIEDFNKSIIASAETTWKFDNDSNDSMDIAAIRIGNPAWSSDIHFSKFCLQFNGQQDGLAIPQATPISSFSLWVYIDRSQHENACLLEVEGHPNSTLSSQVTGDFWEKIYINGKESTTYRYPEWNAIPKEAWVHLHLQAKEAFTGTIHLMTNPAQDALTAGKLAGFRTFQAVLNEEALTIDRNLFGNEKYRLQQGAAPRYYEPAEPVVMIAGETVAPGTRHGFEAEKYTDGLLPCDLLTVNSLDFNAELSDNTITELTSGMDDIFQDTQLSTEENTAAWHPFRLDWEVEVETHPANPADADWDYSPHLINDHFTLSPEDNELTAKTTPNNPETVSYQGSALMARHATPVLQEALLSYIKTATYDTLNAIVEANKEIFKKSEPQTK